jgi:hypothetical protein
MLLISIILLRVLLFKKSMEHWSDHFREKIRGRRRMFLSSPSVLGNTAAKESILKQGGSILAGSMASFWIFNMLNDTFLSILIKKIYLI